MKTDELAKLNDSIFSRAVRLRRLALRGDSELFWTPLAEIALLAKRLESHIPPERMAGAYTHLSGMRSGKASVELGVVEGYAGWSQTYDDEANPLICVEEDALRARLGDVSGKKVLDAACGTGRHALWLAEAGAQVYGLDATDEMLEKARAKAAAAGQNIVFCRGDINNLPYPDGVFDIVVCALALAHSRDLNAPVSEFARVLKPGGRVVVSDFHPYCLLLGWRTTFTRAQTAYFIEDYNHLTQDYIRALLEGGFKLLDLSEEVIDDRLLAIWPPEEVEHYRGFPAALIIFAEKGRE